MEDLSQFKELGYDIQGKVGSGGMGAVYDAYQTAMRRHVAIKVLPEELADNPDYLERFNREALTLTQLEHPHIVPVYDYGALGKTSYIIMRLLKGGTLNQRMLMDPLTLGETYQILQQICSALDYAHNKGVIHRDIKASNVMLDEQGNAYLTDFGIAKLLHATTGITATGMMLGTPAYMAPEQWKGALSNAQTDIYALGVLLYAMLTGQLPFEAPTPYALMDKHLNEKAVPPTKFNMNLPEGVNGVLNRAMAKEPDNRFQSARIFFQAFDQALETAPTKTGDPLPVSESTFIVDTDSFEGMTITKPNEVDNLQEDVPTTHMREQQEAQKASTNWKKYALGAVAVIVIISLLGLIGAFLPNADNPDDEKNDVAVQSTATAEASLTGEANEPTILANIPTETITPNSQVNETSDGVEDDADNSTLASEEFSGLEATANAVEASASILQTEIAQTSIPLPLATEQVGDAAVAMTDEPAPTSEETEISEPTATNTVKPSATDTATTSSPTLTDTVTSSPTNTNTTTATPTQTNTVTSTSTRTPKPTVTLTHTPSPTNTPLPTSTPLPLPTATPLPTQIPGLISTNPVTSNGQWIPIERTINGVPMVLVPAGSFRLGNTTQEYNTLHTICLRALTEASCSGLFDNSVPSVEITVSTPFWIDKTEVTNLAFYGSTGNATFPASNLDWSQAQNHCVQNGGRLPTEVEWEYAARGPDNLIFPWGNTWDNRSRVNYCDQNCASSWSDTSYNDQYADKSPVGAYPEGASWVGALDMGGNVWEWTSTIFRNYPYSATDGRENTATATTQRTLRGGSWTWVVAQTSTSSRATHINSGPYTTFYGFRCIRNYQDGDLTLYSQ